MEPITLCIKIMIGEEDEANTATPKLSPEEAKKKLTNMNAEFTDGMPMDALKDKFKEIATVTDQADGKEEDTSNNRFDDQTEPKSVAKRLFEKKND